MHSQARTPGTIPAAISELWGTRRGSRPGPQPRFTVSQIAAAAMAVADRDGLGGLALASVAAELGIATTGLYRYVDSKGTLVEIAVDHAVGPAPELPATDWREAVRQWSRLLLDVHRAHPWLSDVRPTGVPRTPNPLSWIGSLLGALQSAGGVTDPMSATLLIEGIVRTYAAMLLSVRASDPDEVTRFLSRLTHDRDAESPSFTGVGQRDWGDVDQEFEFAIETVLRGLATGVDVPTRRARRRRER